MPCDVGKEIFHVSFHFIIIILLQVGDHTPLTLVQNSQVLIRSGDGLVPYSRQAITQTNEYPVHPT